MIVLLVVTYGREKIQVIEEQQYGLLEEQATLDNINKGSDDQANQGQGDTEVQVSREEEECEIRSTEDSGKVQESTGNKNGGRVIGRREDRKNRDWDKFEVVNEFEDCTTGLMESQGNAKRCHGNKSSVDKEVNNRRRCCHVVGYTAVNICWNLLLTLSVVFTIFTYYIVG